MTNIQSPTITPTKIRETKNEIKRHDFDNDNDLWAHFVPSDQIERALLYGEEAEALCGKKWIPSRPADGFPVCPTCQSMYDDIKKFEDLLNGNK
jgi:hypothetical protein